MSTLHLTAEHLQTLRHHAETTYPQECCGLLVGTIHNDHKILVEVKPVANAWQQQSQEYWPEETTHTTSDRYAIAPETLLAEMKAARTRHLDIIGIYHSHPDHPAIPSELDRVLAWPQYSYIIISVTTGQAVDCQSWSLDENHQFQSEAMLGLE